MHLYFLTSFKRRNSSLGEKFTDQITHK